jgi:hypothetical protein
VGGSFRALSRSKGLVAPENTRDHEHPNGVAGGDVWLGVVVCLPSESPSSPSTWSWRSQRSMGLVAPENMRDKEHSYGVAGGDVW